MSLKQLIAEEQTEIVRRFVAEVERKDLAPAGTSKSMLVDHVPRFLAEVVVELEPPLEMRPSLDALDTSASAREHGGQRFGLGYDLQALVREYGLLRQVIFAIAKARGLELTMDEMDVLAKCLNVGVAEAVSEYTAFRDEELAQVARAELAKVEAASRAKDEFVALVSHELRTPLHAIVGWVRLLRSGSLPEAQQRHAYEVIERNAAAQGQLVADLLDISQAAKGKIRISPSQVDLSNLIEIVAEQARVALEAKRIELVLELDREHSTLRGDAERLQQIVWNLLTNALKFTPKGGRIEIKLKRVESDLELSVRDSGKGIAPEQLGLIFDAFRQSEPAFTREHGGLGIGLSITRHLVTLHGGTIVADSAGLGQGATFTLRLPVSPLVSPTLGVSKLHNEPGVPPPLPGTGELAGVRVLVVDDDTDARELITILLETCGVEVRAASSAADAFVKLRDFVPDVLLSDIGMPDVDGHELVRRLRALADPALAKLPAIALTAFVGAEERAQALRAGFSEYLTKPVEPAYLVAIVAQLSGHAAS